MPSRRMLLHLAEHLAVPLTERNRLLQAAGYAPMYHERSLLDEGMGVAREALRVVLDSHEPSPALIVDRRWNLVSANTAAAVFLDGVDPALLIPPVNMMRLGLHPLGFASRLLNLDEVRSALLARLARQARQSADSYLSALYDELMGYASPAMLAEPGAHDIALPIRIRHRGKDLAFISTIATFGTALDITLEQIAIESYFPADASTASVFGGRPDFEDASMSKAGKPRQDPGGIRHSPNTSGPSTVL